MLASGRHVSLGKRLKKLVCLLRREANSCVCDGELEFDFILSFLEQLDFQPNLATFSELDRVIDEVCQNLPQPKWIAAEALRDTWSHMREELETLFVRFLRGQGGDGVNEFIEFKVDGFNIQLAGFNLGKVEDVINH